MKNNIKRIVAALLAVVLLPSLASCKIKPSKKPAPLSAMLLSIYDDSNLTNIYRKDKERFTKAIAPKYGMNEADAAAFAEGKGNWGTHILNVVITNKEEATYTFTGFEAENFNTDGIWLCNESNNGELSIPGGIAGQGYPASILVNYDKVSVYKLYETVAGLNLSITYYPTPADDDIEPSADSIKKLTVDNKIVLPQTDDNAPETEISATISSVEDGTDFLDAYKNSDIAFSNESKLYGMDSETAAHVIADDSKWECYVLNISVENKSDGDLTIYTVNAGQNGINGVWICGVSQYGEFGLPSGAKEELPVTVLFDPDVTGGRGIEELIRSMNIFFGYAKTPDLDSFGNEELVVTKSVDVK